MPTEASVEDAHHFIVKYLRQGPSDPSRGWSTYGYGLYLPNVMREFAAGAKPAALHETEQYLRPLSPSFYAAAWDLCRRGILRPGVRQHGLQATDDGAGGNGYSVTPFGQEWLRESDRDDYVPTEPERFGAMLKPYHAKFGPGFHERSQQAIRCYGAHAYLACCVMCGAAGESILLGLAIAKIGNEAEVLKTYSAAMGRGRIEAKIVGQLSEPLRREFQGYTALLKYWRDEAAHGKASTINDNEAYTSLALLLRLAKFAEDRWADLTSRAL